MQRLHAVRMYDTVRGAQESAGSLPSRFKAGLVQFAAPTCSELQERRFPCQCRSLGSHGQTVSFPCSSPLLTFFPELAMFAYRSSIEQNCWALLENNMLTFPRCK